MEHIEEISVIAALAASAFYDRISRSKLSGLAGTLNNNAIAIAQNSTATIEAALSKVNGIAEMVQGYKDEFASLLVVMVSAAQSWRRVPISAALRLA